MPDDGRGRRHHARASGHHHRRPTAGPIAVGEGDDPLWEQVGSPESRSLWGYPISKTPRITKQ